MLEFYWPIFGPSVRRSLWGLGTPCFSRWTDQIEAERVDRENWLAGIQKRLGLLTRTDVDALLATRLGALYG